MTKFTTTLNQIRAHRPCTGGWQKLLSHLGKTKADDEPLSLLTVLDSNGVDDALWCARAIQGHDRDWRLFAVWAERQAPTDAKFMAALDVAERYAEGKATEDELNAVGTAVWSAVESAAGAVWHAARVAAWEAMIEGGDEVWAATREAQAERLRQMVEDGGWVGSTS